MEFLYSVNKNGLDFYGFLFYILFFCNLFRLKLVKVRFNQFSIKSDVIFCIYKQTNRENR